MHNFLTTAVGKIPLWWKKEHKKECTYQDNTSLYISPPDNSHPDNSPAEWLPTRTITQKDDYQQGKLPTRATPHQDNYPLGQLPTRTTPHQDMPH